MKFIKIYSPKKLFNFAIYTLIFIFLCLVFYINYIDGVYFTNIYNLLADSFLKGQLNFSAYGPTDVSLYKGKYYYALGPLPAVILMPFVFISGIDFNTGLTIYIFNLINFFLLAKIAKHYFSKDYLWYPFAYFFASVYLGIALPNASWYFNQLLTTTFTLLAIYFFLKKSNPFLVGLGISLAISCRIFVIILSLFFLILYFAEKKQFLKKIKNLTLFLLPVLITLLVLGYYNYLRFENFFETGYNIHAQEADSTILQSTVINRNKGLFRVQNIPTNFYYYFLKGPEPILATSKPDEYLLKFPFIKASDWSLAFIFTSPFFFLFLFRKPKTFLSQVAYGIFFLILFFLLSYFTTGYRQFGTRFLNDILPLLFLITLEAKKGQGLKVGEKVLITASATFNLYLYLVSWLMPAYKELGHHIFSLPSSP